MQTSGKDFKKVMKLIYEIETRDNQRTRHECNDFASFSGDFITLFKKDFVREHIRTETVLHVKQYFK